MTFIIIIFFFYVHLFWRLVVLMALSCLFRQPTDQQRAPPTVANSHALLGDKDSLPPFYPFPQTQAPNQHLSLCTFDSLPAAHSLAQTARRPYMFLSVCVLDSLLVCIPNQPGAQKCVSLSVPPILCLPSCKYHLGAPAVLSHFMYR